MIVWRGWGILALLIMLAAIVLIQLLAQGLMGPTGYSRNSGWLFPLGLLIAAPIVWVVGKRFNSEPDKVLLDPQTGQEVRLRRSHTFFFIPMEWWGPIMGVLGLVLLVSNGFRRP